MFNIGSAILVSTCLILGTLYGWSWWLLLLALMGLGSWVFVHGDDRDKRLKDAKIQAYAAVADYLDDVRRDR